MRFIFFITACLFIVIAAPFAAQAESGFGTGFTEQSAKAFEDPATQEPDEDMAAAAEEAQDIAPAAGEEQNAEPETSEAGSEKTDNSSDGIVLHGEIINDGTFIELTD